ncbi:TPA: hypothetical protein ACGYNV_001345 [Listeria monocytogenes]|uniref:hypothetical protein n=1 Tax=Listeria TaxID=1637 RepID=UPI000985DC9B|nr:MULTISPECIES: hypothetical protein [Listeria]EAC5365857.1 hypothetical protein [Listeria monocytogenes]EAC5777335.1 hypothetical protein [Listeria monocytogenes]EAC9743193.1 hypothetical protein [Listeria monocytogenes]EAE0204904.1 hypothetical protein [Listeria monocytogenes]EAE9690452.1 hypothetical protein [Listeria monocytogenes]
MAKSNVRKTVIDALPIANMDNNVILQFKNGLFYTILLLRSTDINALNEDESIKAIGQFARFNTQYIDPYKIISMRFPADTKEQQRYWKKMLHSSKCTLQRTRCHETLQKLKLEETEKSNQEYYLMIFGKSVKELEHNYQKVIRLSDMYMNVSMLQRNKIQQIHKKLFNLNLILGNKVSE